MGVPALFRWLSRKYPKIVQPVVEDPEAKTDMSTKNPNGQEFDALYLDMNGIVHPCTHPEGKPAPETEQDMMVAIFEYTERVVNMVKPRKLLFMAIDGVAPRAKMNQQRSRRFRAAREATEKEEARLEAIEEWKLLGRTVNEEMLNGKKAWDSNAITPGTPFMDLLASCLRYWVAKKMNSSPGWQGLTVIISDASVPGEGEHKIMDYIRRQRVQPNYNPNTKHVIYGLDADLIMLSLATHEPHFKVLREDVFLQANKPRGCHRCGLPGHHSSMCTAPLDKIKKAQENDAKLDTARKPFIFLDVGVLREYLEIELDVPNVSFPFDFERSLDDWVFMIFFVGNDFLPHLPSLEIREGAIDVLLEIWKKELPAMGGYLTEHGQVKMDRAQFILDGLAAREDEIFRKRREAEERQDRGEKRRRIDADQANRENHAKQTNEADSIAASAYVQIVSSITNNSGPSSLPNKPPFLPPKPAGFLSKTSSPSQPIDTKQVRADNLSAAERLKAELRGEILPPPEADSTVTEDAKVEESPRGTKRKADEADVPSTRAVVEGEQVIEQVPLDAEEEEEEEEDAGDASVLLGVAAIPAPKPLKVLGDNMVEQEDTVKLYEPGYKERYYKQKFGVELSDVEFRNKVVKSYMEGLCWVLAYYYQGCPSWQWFYPYHFAPFASDFTDLATLDIKFDLGEPFKPYEQLMGVFPAASRQHIPVPYQGLMIEDDSPIIDFYPETFDIDMNGKKMLWQGVALLPFIEQDRLLEALAPRQAQLSDDEKRRNARGHDAIFVHEEHPLWTTISNLYAGAPRKEPLVMNPSSSKGMFGSLLPDPECVPGATYFSPLDLKEQGDIDNDRSVASFYYFPKQSRPHRSVLLPGAITQKNTLDGYDKDVVRRGGVPDQRHRNNGGGGYHQNRRDIDGVGVRRPQRGGYNNNGPSRQQNNDPYSGYDQQPRYPTPPSSGYNSPQMQYQQPPRPYTAPVQPIVNNGNQYGNYGGYRPPQTYQQPQHTYFPPQQQQQHQQQYGGVPAPPPGFPQPPPTSYGGYGQYRPPQPGQQQPYQQPPMGNNTAFANAQALLRSIPQLQNQQQQPPYYRQ